MVRKYRKSKFAKEKIQWDSYHDDDLIPIEVAAELLGMSVPFIKKWSGKTIPFYKIGASARFKITDLKVYLENCRIEKNVNDHPFLNSERNSPTVDFYIPEGQN